MNIKWKSIFLVMLIILSICAVFTTLFILDSRENLKNIVDTEIASIQAIVKTIEKENSRRYQTRIKTYTDYKELPHQKKTISAFARQDRGTLLQLSAPFLNVLRKEDPNLSTFSWVTPDNLNFLRVHRPEKFGDKVSKMRPDVVLANKDQHLHSGYMIAKTGLQYRLVQPVSYEGQHVGIVQFGLEDSMLLDMVNEELNVAVGMAILNKKFSFITYSKLPSLAGSTHTIQSKQIALFQQDNNSIDWNRDHQKVTLHGKSYIIANVLSLLDYHKKSQGYLFVAVDISKQEEKLQARILVILLVSGVLLLLSFFILNSSYSSLIQKIIDLNKALQQSNKNLESQVEQRTENLQNALDEIKTLEGILPLCSYCKKIRNEEDKWEEVDAYIYKHSPADISHSICPECAKIRFPEHCDNAA